MSRMKKYIQRVIPLLIVGIIGCGDSPILTGPGSDEPQRLAKPAVHTANVALQVVDAASPLP